VEQSQVAGTQSAQIEQPRLSAYREQVVDPASVREIVALVLIIVLSDLTVFRGEGYAGYAAMLIGVPLLVLAGAARRRTVGVMWLMLLFLSLVVARLVWCGSPGALVTGSFLAVCVVMAQSGRPPWVLHAAVFASRMFAAGHRALIEYSGLLARWSPQVPRTGLLSIAFPAATVIVFGVVFTLANPDLLATVSRELERLTTALQKWLIDFSPRPLEVLFWVGVAWLAAGVLRPSLDEEDDDVTQVDAGESSDVESASLYVPFRNTLVSVIVLFLVYLVFEFQTLWFRVFPEGFHYSGYAHEGAAWLTVALALATVLLSIIFRGRVLRDPRVRRLQRLAWMWSALNLLLATAVVHRLLIYVDFNGMTRMRTVGFLGIGSVVVGFVFVVAKIVQQRNFRWLIRRHLWTVTFAAYLYCVLPVDAFVTQYNVRRILNGDPAPSVQIIAHPTSAEGLLQLFPLLECDNTAIRDGVSAMLASEFSSRRGVPDVVTRHWTAFQFADHSLLERLEAESARWTTEVKSATASMDAINAFRDYAWQWY
jgi:hypothetical protein